MCKRFWLTGLICVCFAAAISSLSAKDVSEEDVLFAAGKWLDANTVFWGDGVAVKPAKANRMTNVEGKTLPLWFVSLSPKGYIVFSSDDTLPPVVAFGTNGDFSKNKIKKASDTFLQMLSKQGKIFQEALDSEKTRGDSTSAENLQEWNALLGRTRAEPIEPGTIIRAPMLETEWSQDVPFNFLCPSKAVTGCVAVAVGQVMKFHEWPVAGTGSKENKDTEGSIRATINADFSFPYHWDAIGNEYSGLETTETALPLARLLMDGGTLGAANYELGETEAFPSDIHKFLPPNLNYSSSIQFGDTRTDFFGYTSQATLYSRIRTDMEEGRPAIVAVSEPFGHAFVADGLGTSGGKDYYHLNYGWSGYNDGWYLLTDGYSSSVVNSATTNIIPNAIPVFKPISAEQKSSFTLAWDFPKRITADAFRLSKSSGTRATRTVVDTLPGTARSYNLTGQSGTSTYTLEAQVNGKWQPASEGVTITTTSSPAALPTIAVSSVLKSIAGAVVTTTVTSSTTLKSLTVASSRPDILPASGISVTGSGAARTVKLTPLSGIYGNVLLYVTATDNAGNVIKTIAMLSVIKTAELVWHTTLSDAVAAADDEQFILMVAGQDTSTSTNNFRNTVCEMDDIKENLLENYSLWFCNINNDDSWQKYLGHSGIIYFPVIAVIDKSNTNNKIRSHEGVMGEELAREFLSLQNPYFSLDDSGDYAPMLAQTLELSVLERGADIHYRMDATAPSTTDMLYSEAISISNTTTITAQAFMDDLPIGEPVTKTYSFLGLEECPETASIASGDGISFYSAGSPWTLQTKTVNSEPSAMQSGRIDDSESSFMIAKVTGSGKLSFYWKVSCEAGYDGLSFRIDGEEKVSITGVTAWEKKEFTIKGRGEHVFFWTYHKDESDNDNEDCGWVDDVVWTPDAPDPVVDFSVDLEIGWNLVAMTLELDEESVNALLRARAILFDSSHKAYRRAFAKDIVPGVALWVFTKEAKEMVLHGYEAPSWKFKVSQGWNLIGAVNDVTKKTWSKKATAVKEWTGSEYIDVGNMEKGKAYWVYGK